MVSFYFSLIFLTLKLMHRQICNIKWLFDFVLHLQPFLYWACWIFYRSLRGPIFTRMFSEMEFLNGIFSWGYWPWSRVYSESSFCMVFYPHFPFYKMLFMNRLELSCFASRLCTAWSKRLEYLLNWCPRIPSLKMDIFSKLIQ
jgi:hypothetical protein